MKTEFYLIKGLLSEYGLCCGYVQRETKNNKYVELYKEHNTYHVRTGNIGVKYDKWLSFDKLTQARKEYSKLLKLLQ